MPRADGRRLYLRFGLDSVRAEHIAALVAVRGVREYAQHCQRRTASRDISDAPDLCGRAAASGSASPCSPAASAMSADVMMSHVAKGKYVVKAEQRLCTLVEIISYNV